jgi:hypothetical protein
LLLGVERSDKSAWMSECGCAKRFNERKLLAIHAI